MHAPSRVDGCEAPRSQLVGPVVVLGMSLADGEFVLGLGEARERWYADGGMEVVAPV